ncbi:hypothetical protein [Teichococcus oryzae]|nr:hypothetical protein [Pseudoroseomonas oryzae]
MSIGSFVIGLSALFAAIHVFERHVSLLAQRSPLAAESQPLVPPSFR